MARPLRVGVNALYLIPGGVGGTEIYLRNLLQGFCAIDAGHEYFLFTNRETSDLAPCHPGFHEIAEPVPARFRPMRLGWEQTVLPWRARALQLDVLFNPGFTAPAWCPCPQVTVFHDLQHRRHPEFFRWFDLPFWRLFLYASATRSDRLIAVSDATRSDLVSHYGLADSRVTTVLHGVEPAFFAIGRERRLEDLDPFLLCVSTLHPHKNIERLVRAFAAVHQRHPEFRLVLAGMPGFQSAQVEREIRDCGLTGHVEMTGWLAREEIYSLFHRAWGFVYPSLFEGFGMPVLEAMAAGIPVAASAIDPIREVAADAALLFDPRDDAALAAALVCIVSDDALRAGLSVAGPRRAAQFSWNTAAAETLRVLEAVAGG